MAVESQNPPSGLTGRKPRPCRPQLAAPTEALSPLARLLARVAAREVLAAGNRGGRDSEASRAPTESVVRPPVTPKFEQETGA